jgi:hypothetical protein
MSYKTIKLKNYLNHFEEFTAAAAIYPGMLVEQTPSAATIRKHATSGGNVTVVCFAIEDALQGKGITDAYATGDKVQVWYPVSGDVVYALVADEQNIAIGDELESNGAGFLTKHTVKSWGSADSMIAETIYTSAVVGKAIEALDLSGLSAQGTSDTPLRQFIKVRIR